MTVHILTGDVLARLADLPDGSVHCVVTSPPYYGLRSYLPPEHPSKALEIGSEPMLAAYVARMVEVFRAVRRVLRPDGVCWLNLGDSYANDEKWGGRTGGKHVGGREGHEGYRMRRHTGAKPKDLLGVPWRVAFALQDDGWYLRRDIIWAKDSCMPESVTDRCTSSHEYVFHLTKSAEYFYDAEAIAEPVESGPSDVKKMVEQRSRIGGKHLAEDDGALKFSSRTNIGKKRSVGDGATRNKRSVWRINPQPFAESHFATMPPALAEICILAGTSERGCCPTCGAPWERIVEKGEPDEAAKRASGADLAGGYNGASTKGHAAAGVQDASAVKARILEGMRVKRTVGWRRTCSCQPRDPVPCTVLDPFGGAGTTGLVADRLRRDAVLIELNPEYVAMAEARLRGDGGMFAEVAA